MFEQSQLSRAATRRPLSFAVSLLSQALVIATVAVATVVHVQDLPAGDWTRVLIAPRPPAARSPPRAAEPVRGVAPQRFEAELRQPAQIPDEAAVIVEDQPVAEAASSFEVLGAAPGAGPGAGVLESILPSAVAPPPPPAPEPAPARAEPKPSAVRVSQGAQAAKLIHRVTPAYPPMAIASRIQGVVRLQAIIGEDGSIDQLEVVDGHPFLVQEAVRAVSQWRYRPTLLSGRPVSVVTQIDVHFRLD